MKSRVRLFVAIPLPSSAATSLREHTHALTHLSPQLRWLKPESWHLTLQFLGSVMSERAEALAYSLGTVGGSPIQIQISQLECFERARVLAALIRPSPQLDALQTQVVRVTAEHGFPAESRPFTPHVTLARWKGSLSRLTSNALTRTQLRGEFLADRFALFQSFTGPAGARYEILRTYPLA